MQQSAISGHGGRIAFLIRTIFQRTNLEQKNFQVGIHITVNEEINGLFDTLAVCDVRHRNE
jgi:hypothetical protein